MISINTNNWSEIIGEHVLSVSALHIDISNTMKRSLRSILCNMLGKLILFTLYRYKDCVCFRSLRIAIEIAHFTVYAAYFHSGCLFERYCITYRLDVFIKKLPYCP